MTQFTCLGGSLSRVAPNQWQWSDGTPEPRVTDLSPSQQYNFRCRTDGGGKTYVEVMLSVAHRERDVLGWVIAGAETGLYPQNFSGDHTGPRVLNIADHYADGDVPGISTPDAALEISRQSVLPDGTPTKRAIPRVALVSIAEWDAWARDNPYGATWPKACEPEIFAKARSLGWKE